MVLRISIRRNLATVRSSEACSSVRITALHPWGACRIASPIIRPIKESLPSARFMASRNRLASMSACMCSMKPAGRMDSRRLLLVIEMAKPTAAADMHSSSQMTAVPSISIRPSPLREIKNADAKLRAAGEAAAGHVDAKSDAVAMNSRVLIDRVPQE